MLVPVPASGHLRVVADGPQDDSFHDGSPPVLLLHGFMGGADAWPDVVVDGLGATRRTLRPDLPGHGPRGGSGRAAPCSLESVVGDLLAVLDAAGAQRADWVGYSMGGRIALAAAVLHPDRVRRLVLESASPGLETEADRSARRVVDEALATQLLTEDFGDFVDNWMRQPLFASQRELGSRWAAVERERRLALDPQALASCLRGLGTGTQPSFWAQLGTVRARTLLLVGALDAKFSEVATRMVDLVPAAELEIVPDAGHRVHSEQPGPWLDRVVPFLNLGL